MQVRRIESIAPERWRNGGGITRAVASEGDDWRVSIAEVERDGPYSSFEGIARISLVLRGLGVKLRHADDSVILMPFEAVEYDGGTAWDASLIGGTVTALNVMTRIGTYRARVQAIVRPVTVDAGYAAVVVALDAECRCDSVSIGTGEVAVIAPVDRSLRFEAIKGTPFLVTIERIRN
jgi:uncharacterized protein